MQKDSGSACEEIQAKIDSLAVEYACKELHLAALERLTLAGRLEKFLVPTKKRGRKSNYFRDRDIALAIRELSRLGYKPTRTHHSKSPKQRHCGCSIVAEALAMRGPHLSEHAIVKIWERRDALFKSLFVRNNSAEMLLT
jgi:hypothetical protein